MSTSMRDRVAMVTGGGGAGIGRTICERFAAEGATIVVADQDVAAAQETVRRIEASGGTALALAMDVSNGEQVTAGVATAVERFGGIDILVCSAAFSDGTDILTIDEDRWDRHLAVVLKGPYLCAKAVLPGMIAANSGVILTIGSVNGLFGIGEEPYSAAKAGLINLTRNLAVRYGKHGIRANCICPGTIRTYKWDIRLEREPDALEKVTRWYPLGRVGTPADIANAAWFLCSDLASWITGEVLNVDGGLMAGSDLFRHDLDGGRRAPS